MLVFIAIVTVVVAVVAAGFVARLRRKRLQKRFRLEITNQGNVRSRYRLRAEDAEAGRTGDPRFQDGIAPPTLKTLDFRFVLGGDSLPEMGRAEATTGVAQPGVPGPAGPPPSAKGAPAKGADVRKKANQALTASGAIAELLITLGTILPSSVGAPLFQKASQLRQGQIQASRVERMPGQVAWLKPSAAKEAQAGKSTGALEAARPAAAQRATAEPFDSAAGSGQQAEAAGSVPADGQIWVQTPFVQPGETLAVDLFIRSVTSHKSQHRLFQVLSCSTEQENAPVVAEEGSVQIGGGFWTRRYLPYLIIVAAAITILLLAFWLANVGALA